MAEGFQSEINDLKNRIAKIEVETLEAKSLILDRQVQLTAEAHRLANLGSLCSELRSEIDSVVADVLDRRFSV